MFNSKTNKKMSSLRFTDSTAINKFNRLLENAKGFAKVKGRNQHTRPEDVLTASQNDFFLEILRVYEQHTTNGKKTASREMCEYCINQMISGEPIDFEHFMTVVRTEKNEEKQAQKVAYIQESIENLNAKIEAKTLQITVGMLNKPYKLGGLGFYKEVALESWIELKAEIESYYKKHLGEAKMVAFENARENNQKVLKTMKTDKLKKLK